MVCRNCGSKLFKGDKFCSKCGTRVTEETPAEAQAAAEKSDVETPMSPAGVGNNPAEENEKATEESEKQGSAIEEAGAETFAGGIASQKSKAPQSESEAAKSQTETQQSEPEAVKREKTEAQQSESEAVKQEKTEAASERTVPPGIPEEKPSKTKKRIKKKGTLKENSAEKKKSIAPKVILGVFGLALVVLLANSAKIVNYFHRNFSAPEEYYRWVESRAVNDYAKTVSEYYVGYIVEYLHGYDRSVSAKISLEVKDAGKDMLDLAGLAGADLSWFEKGSFTLEQNSKNNVTQSIWGLDLGGERLLSMEAILDFNDAAAYLGFPELSKTYMTVDMDNPDFAEGFSYIAGVEPDEYVNTLELMEILYKEFPDKKQVEALTARYLELFLDHVEDVKMRTGKTVRAEGVTQSCTSLVIYLDKTDIQNMMAEFLEELQDDEAVEELLIQIYDMMDELDIDMGYYRNADDFYDAFLDEIDDILDDMDYYITYHDELKMTVYVDNKGQIIGRTLEFPNSWDEVTLSYIMPHRGRKFGYKGSIEIDGEEISIVGSGKDFANKLSGDFTVKYEGMGIVDVAVKDFNLKSLKKGYINGNFTVTAASGISRALDLASSYSYLSDMELVIDISSSKSSEKMSMTLKEGKDIWGTLTVTINRGNGKKVSVPSTRSSILVEDDWDFEDWWDTLKWNDFLKKLDKANLPSETIDAAEEFSELESDEVLDRISDFMRSIMYDLMYELF